MLALVSLPRTAAAVEPATDVAPERPPWIAVAPFLGGVVFGRGAQALECTGACAGFAGTETGYAHAPAFLLGAEVLFGVGRYLRLGPSLRYTFSSTVELAGTESFQVGSDWTASAAIEGFIPVASRWGVAPRLEGGLLVLSPGGDLSDYLDALRVEFCPIVTEGCAIGEGARVGWTAGFGGGVWYRAAQHVRVRLDLRVHYYSLTLYTLGATLSGGPIEVSESLSGGRLSVTSGVEFF
jgi:hypothetical protein